MIMGSDESRFEAQLWGVRLSCKGVRLSYEGARLSDEGV